MAETLKFSSFRDDPKEREALAEQIADEVRGRRSNGRRCRMALGGQDVERVNATIEILGLSRLDALKKNRADIWERCVERIKDYENSGNEPSMRTRVALCLVAVSRHHTERSAELRSGRHSQHA